MSWLTPFQNLIIRFKIGSGGSSSGGITEELLNSKLAAFYTSTETKILNLVNSKLATYVTQTAFNELETKVETNTTNISNLGNNITTNTNNINSLTTRVTTLEKNNTGTGTKLSMITGTMEVSGSYTTGQQVLLSYLTIFQSKGFGVIKLPSGGTISANNINKYLIGYDYGFNIDNFIKSGPSPKGFFIKQNTLPQFGLINTNIPIFRVVYVGNDAPQVIMNTSNVYMNVTLILSDTVENITKTLKSANALINETNENNTLEIVSWVNL